MRRITTTTIIALALTVSPCRSAPLRGVAEPDVRAALEQYLSFVDYPNPPRLDPHLFARDVQAFWSKGQTYADRQSVIRALEDDRRQAATHFKSLDAQARNVSIHGSGDIAWVTCEIHIKGELRQTSGPYQRAVRSTFIFERREGRWQMTHEHSSPLRPQPDRIKPAPETGFVPKVIEFQGKSFRYAVWVPPDYTPDKRWPVILFLHGKGECGEDGELQTTVGLGQAIRDHPERFPALVVMPQIPVDRAWEGPMQELALATLEATLNKYTADHNRVVLTGLSLGGYGTWSLGAQYPEKFCALVPICGGGDRADADKLTRLPIWCFHGEADPVVPVQRSREMVAAVRTAGGQIRYTEFPGVTHNSWDPAYSDPEVIAWMLGQRR